MKKQYHAWAVDTQSDEGHRLIGLYWPFFDTTCYHLPDHALGARVALFQTRQNARDALKFMNSKKYISFPKAKVVKVSITLEWDR